MFLSEVLLKGPNGPLTRDRSNFSDRRVYQL